LTPFILSEIFDIRSSLKIKNQNSFRNDIKTHIEYTNTYQCMTLLASRKNQDKGFGRFHDLPARAS
jgi:hypothetical protein